MRVQRLVSGLNNSQKIRFMIDGFGMYCKVVDIENFATSSHRVAVFMALQNLQASRELAFSKCQPQPTGFGFNGTFQGVKHDVQVDLV